MSHTLSSWDTPALKKFFAILYDRIAVLGQTFLVGVAHWARNRFRSLGEAITSWDLRKSFSRYSLSCFDSAAPNNEFKTVKDRSIKVFFFKFDDVQIVSYRKNPLSPTTETNRPSMPENSNVEKCWRRTAIIRKFSRKRHFMQTFLVGTWGKLNNLMHFRVL